ncbi:hypothetical protein Poli38472_001345 [Pythium oligandrum]|uniref:Uncharacterized protein n=1 Tax=Pythium oligandrum TaxID=41045 RepID=A0A8K1CTC1_PYTOL|nr:hypothetical protein Poli38472_001345 [Pythium oligandrum]|eukprot:TMW69189.1 hypothetical protein Poli38472_001345 [Pythium oligandrum]
MEPFKLTLEGVMKKVDFTDVAEIRKIPQEVIYYQPMVKIFGALSALILDGVNNRCYGLLMTTSHENSLAWSPFNCVLKRLAEINLSEHFCVCFVVPTHMQAKYNRQPILSENQLLHLEPGDEGYVPQFVCGFNAFAAN